MRTHKVLAAAAAPLALAALFLAGGRAADEKDLKANLEKVVKTAADKPDDVQKAGADFAKANRIDNDSIKDVMDFLGKLEPRPSAGASASRAPSRRTASRGSFAELTKVKMRKDQLKQESDALIELANRTAAVGSVGLASPPKKVPAGQERRRLEEVVPGDDRVLARVRQGGRGQ